MANLPPGLRIVYDASNAPIGIAAPDGTNLQVNGISPGYFCHIYAPVQNNGATASTDTFLQDQLYLNDGTFGANLPAASAWANLGYVSTLDPQAAAVDSGLSLPPLGWDWAGGESLLIFWKGMVTPEGATTSLMGQSASAVKAGPQFRALATGHIDLVLNTGDGTNRTFMGGTTSGNRPPLVAGEKHSFAMLADPIARTCAWYVDGLLSNTVPMTSTVTVNSNEKFRIGTASVTPSASDGLAVRMEALHILKGRKNKSPPANIAKTIMRLHRNPGRQLTSEAW